MIIVWLYLHEAAPGQDHHPPSASLCQPQITVKQSVKQGALLDNTLSNEVLSLTLPDTLRGSQCLDQELEASRAFLKNGVKTTHEFGGESRVRDVSTSISPINIAPCEPDSAICPQNPHIVEGTRKTVPSEEPTTPKITWYCAQGSRIRSFSLRIAEKLWQIDFQHLQLPIFEPLLNKGLILSTHKQAYDDLSNYLDPKKSDKNFVVISGLAGSGKSRLVQYYLHELGKKATKHPTPSVAWLNGQDTETFRAQWESLAEQFRSIDSAMQQPCIDDGQVIRTWLERQTPWLLIIDDLTTMDVAELLSKCPLKGGRVVITTRWDVKTFKTFANNVALQDITMPTLTTDDAQTLLEAYFGRHWNLSAEELAIKQLIEALGGYAQNLVQAALTIRHKGIDFQHYLTQLTTHWFLCWKLLCDTNLGQMPLAKTMAYNWGSSQRLLQTALEQRHPKIDHASILKAWLALDLGDGTAVLDSSRQYVMPELSSKWQERIKDQHSDLNLTESQIKTIWADYQELLTKYLPLEVSKEAHGESWRVCLVAAAIFRHGCSQVPKDVSISAMTQANFQPRTTDIQSTSDIHLSPGAQVGNLSIDILKQQVPGVFKSLQPPPVNPDFIKRDDATEEDATQKLVQKLTNVSNIGSSSDTVIVAVVGMGGIGKTELVSHYLHVDAEKANQNYTRRFWLTASNEKQLLTAYRQLAVALQLIVPEDTYQNMDTVVLEQLHTWLGLNPGWLLVVDNADDYPSIEPWLPPKGGTVLITTRAPNPGRPGIEGNIIPLKVLQPNKAVSWLEQLSDRDLNNLPPREKIAANKLVNQLGCLPLALAIVGASLRVQTEVTIRDYLDSFNKKSDLLLGAPTYGAVANDTSDDESKARQVISKTWILSLEAIQKQDKTTLAPELLEACAYLAPGSIPVLPLTEWLSSKYPEDTAEQLLIHWLVDNHLAQLRQYSLVQRDYSQPEVVSVHRLVQQVMRERLERAEKQNTINILLDVLAPALYRCYNSADRYVQSDNTKKSIKELSPLQRVEHKQNILFPHMDSLCSHYDQLKSAYETTQGNIEYAELTSSCAHYHQFILLNVERAKELNEKALPTFEKKIRKAVVLHSLGTAWGALGNDEKALECLQNALKIRKKYLQRIKKEKNKFYPKLFYYDSGENGKTLECYYKMLKFKEEEYRRARKKVAETRCNLGILYGALFNLTKQREYLEQALDIEEDLVKNSEEYIRTRKKEAEAQYHLPLIYDRLSARQREHLKKALKIKEVKIKEDLVKKSFEYKLEKLSVAITQTHLGECCRLLGLKAFNERNQEKKEKCFENAKKCLESAKTTLDKDKDKENHFRFAFCQENLALLHRDKSELRDNGEPDEDELKEAKKLLKEALESQKDKLHPDHFVLVNRRAHLGDVYRLLAQCEQGKEVRNEKKITKWFDKASKYLEAALPVFQKEYYGKAGSVICLIYSLYLELARGDSNKLNEVQKKLQSNVIACKQLNNTDQEHPYLQVAEKLLNGFSQNI